MKILVTVRVKAGLWIRPWLILGADIHFECKEDAGLRVSAGWKGLKLGIDS